MDDAGYDRRKDDRLQVVGSAELRNLRYQVGLEVLSQRTGNLS